MDVITQFDIPPRKGPERILCHFSSDNFEQYTCSIHESIGRRFCNRAVANAFLNKKRKLSTDSAVANGVKDREKNKLDFFFYPKFLFYILKFYHINS